MQRLTVDTGRLVLVLVLGVFLLGARLALATHPYEHDLGIPGQDCKLCACSYASGDAAVATSHAEVDARRFELPAFGPPSPLPTWPRSACLARGPPSPV